MNVSYSSSSGLTVRILIWQSLEWWLIIKQWCESFWVLYCNRYNSLKNKKRSFFWHRKMGFSRDFSTYGWLKTCSFPSSGNSLQFAVGAGFSPAVNWFGKGEISQVGAKLIVNSLFAHSFPQFQVLSMWSRDLVPTRLMIVCIGPSRSQNNKKKKKMPAERET